MLWRKYLNINSSILFFFRTRADEVQYAQENCIEIAHDGNHLKKPNESYFDSFCLPRILDLKIMGFIKHVCIVIIFIKIIISFVV